MRPYFFALIYTEVHLGSKSGQQWCAMHIETHEGGERDVFLNQPPWLAMKTAEQTGSHM